MYNLYDLIFKFEGTDIPIILDDNKMPWFSAADIATILGYTEEYILNNLSSKDKKLFSEFAHNLKNKSHPNAIYISEPGLYQLAIDSKKKSAIKFRNWILDTILPSIIRSGMYKVEKKDISNIDKLNNKLNDIFENNNKKLDKGVVYAIESESKEFLDNTKIFKIESSINKEVPDKVLYYIQVDNPIPVELCVRSLLYKYKYRAKKDYYICKLSTLINIFDTCNEFIKQYSSTHSKLSNNITDKLHSYLKINNPNMSELLNDNYKQKYTKYKNKYVSSKK